MTRKSFSIYVSLLLVISACTFTQKIKDGETAFERKQYAKAVEMLSAEYEKTRDREFKAYRAYLLGESYMKMNMPESARTWYRQAFEDGYGVDALEKYAAALMADQQYDNAKRAYSKLIDDYGETPEWNEAIASCDQAIQWISEQGNSPYRIYRTDFNSESSDYAPVLLSESEIIFSSDRANEDSKDTYWWTGRSYSNLFLYDKVRQEIRPFNAKFNTPANEGTISFNLNKTEAFFTRCNSEDASDAFCRIFFSKKEGKFWTIPEPLVFQQDGINYVHPAYWPRYDALVFSANTVDDPENYDLYIAFRRGRTWQEPMKMPGNLNTEKKEAFPTFYEDTLYFSSDGLAGMGGLDIFKTHPMQTPQQWSPPVNLEVPVNSGSDDFWLTVDPWFKSDGTVLQRGYFTSTRSTSGTSDDIYSFEKVYVEEPIVEKPPPRKGKIYVEGTVYSRQYNDPNDPNSGQKALLPMPRANLAISTPDSVLRPGLSPKASFFMELEPDKDYEFVANRRGYLNNSYELRTTDEDLTGKPDKIYVVDIVLDPIFFNTEIVLENIYYDFDKWDIREDAKPTLDELSKLLKLNPRIKIELGSHTDCRGNDQYNLELSQRRAQSAVDYMIAQGIEPTRLSARGYGETKPSAQCVCEECTEEQHQENRRTTFRILEG